MALLLFLALAFATPSVATEVFIMLPLDIVSSSGQLKDKNALGSQLDKMRGANIDGFMADIWWGLTEPSPRSYNFDYVRELVDMAKTRSMRVQFVASFHQCGGNVGDVCSIPVPTFVTDTNGIWYKDQFGNEDKEYVSLFADNIAVGGRRIVQMYSDWFHAFATTFKEDLGATITTIQVGLGPAGELRYPAYQLSRWQFCGIGAFQCFDDHAIASFKAAAAAAGHWEWDSPPRNVGDYNTRPENSSFFRDGYKTDYGKFFLDWYFSSLKLHGARILSAAHAAFNGKVGLAGKISGVHWWHNTEHHAAEVTSGYYNSNGRNAYSELAEVFASNGHASVDFTCLEMRDSEQSSECASGPEELVRSVRDAAKSKQLLFSGENALPRYDTTAYGQIESYRADLEAFTYLRLDDTLLQDGNFNNFRDFVNTMRASSAIAV
eukprot:TRINITY_DN3606_c0_g1_i1.p1 TRINITY_DN3606_c0_g1~~TRINITY_DN3606_c0_g1_i1.p1  ORF type:complete len:435 (+),score=80.23 TRINITY_DN3606_c0_g1_i1:88-1392(+)